MCRACGAIAAKHSEQFDMGGHPHRAGEGAAAPQTAPAQAAAGAAAAGAGLMVEQDRLQCGDRAGVLTGPFQLGEPVPHRADYLSRVGLGG